MVIATRASWNGNVLHGDMIGSNCKGPEKIKRIESILGKSISDITYYAFSDNMSDMDLLTNACYSIKVNKNKFNVIKNCVS